MAKAAGLAAAVAIADTCTLNSSLLGSRRPRIVLHAKISAAVSPVIARRTRWLLSIRARRCRPFFKAGAKRRSSVRWSMGGDIILFKRLRFRRGGNKKKLLFEDQILWTKLFNFGLKAFRPTS